MATLTGELAKSNSPLRQWFDQHLPNRTPVYAAFRSTIRHECTEPEPYVVAGTVGAAYDYLVRYILDSTADAPQARDGAAFAAVEMLAEHRIDCALLEHPERPETLVNWPRLAQNLITDVRQLATDLRDRTNGFWSEYDDPFDEEWTFDMLAHGCGVLALLTELARGVPLSRSLLRHYNHPWLVEEWSCIVPPGIVTELRALYGHTTTTLLPFIEVRRPEGCDTLGGLDLGRGTLAAEADIIVGSTLVEIKAMVGKRSPNGKRHWGLRAELLYQMVAYALLAILDDRAIDEIALFNARYGHLHHWPLAELFNDLVGRPIQLVTLAEQFEEFIQRHYSAPSMGRRTR